MLPDHPPDLSEFSESGLFSLYRAILRELKSRDVIRTENAPVGDYAEYLVATTLGGQLAPNSEKAWDVLGSGPSGRNRCHSNPPGSTIWARGPLNPKRGRRSYRRPIAGNGI